MLSFVVPKFTSPMLIVAVAAVFERGTYPIFLARDTTFSLIVAESKNDSFATKFALNALIYVLYAKVSIITEKLEPSKSKSVKFEFERRKSLICALISSKSKFVNCVKGLLSRWF